MTLETADVLQLQLADYVLVHHGDDWIEKQVAEHTSHNALGHGKLYDYVFGSTGVFIRCRRPGLDACVPVSRCEIRGLAPVEPFVRFALPKVPAGHLKSMLSLSRSACVAKGSPVEALFHLIWLEDEGRWRLDKPEQRARRLSVRPVEDGPGSSYERALIEVHSHHQMEAFFSGQDDADEQGFRIYGVLGEIFSEEARFRVRVGCFGHFKELPAGMIFELPDGVRDCAGDKDRGERRDEEE